MEQIKNLEDLVWWIASKHEEKLILKTHFQQDELCWRLSTQEKLHLSTLEGLLVFECTFPFFQN